MQSDSITCQCIVIADDLTGACDSGLEFALVGLRTRIMFDSGDTSKADVLVVSTDSRRMSPDAAVKHVGKIAASLPLNRVKVVFKKIDSALRGNIFEESEVIRRAAIARGVVLAPALPAQGRTVERGILKVRDLAGSWSLDIEQKLKEQGARLERVRIEALSQRLDDAALSSPYFLCDTTSDENLASVAMILWRAPQRTLWIGSAGLAKQLARLLTENSSQSIREWDSHTTDARPVLACIGSDHPVTLHQIKYLKQNRNCVFLEAVSIEASDIADALAQNRHVVLIVDMKQPDSVLIDRLFRNLPTVSLGGILLSGGDTAALICRASHAREIVLSGQIQNGIVAGYIVGGALEGLPIATKSGGFGQEDSLAQSMDFLSTAARLDQQQSI
jgi:uncharacterized protein YgbK (DUF1537 family)